MFLECLGLFEKLQSDSKTSNCTIAGELFEIFRKLRIM